MLLCVVACGCLRSIYRRLAIYVKLASKVLHKIHIEINASFMQDF